jgi:hypothetical protein
LKASVTFLSVRSAVPASPEGADEFVGASAILGLAPVRTFPAEDHEPMGRVEGVPGGLLETRRNSGVNPFGLAFGHLLIAGKFPEPRIEVPELHSVSIPLAIPATSLGPYVTEKGEVVFDVG